MPTAPETQPTAVSDDAARAALDVRVAFGRLRRKFQDVHVERGLTPSQGSLVARLHRGPATAAALAVAEGVRPQSVAATLAALSAAGLVERTPDPTDGRRVLLSLTPAGLVAAEGGRAARQEWLSHAMQETLTAAERATVIEAMALLERIAEK